MPVVRSSKRLKVALLLGAALAGAGAGIGVAVAQGDSSAKPASPADPGTFFAAGSRRAPDFALRDQAGRPISLRSLRGRPVLLAFIDPVCRNLCPFEAKILNDAAGDLPAGERPAVVAVSVNPWAQSRTDLRQDAAKWHLRPEWRWALGGYEALARVWRQYAIGVQVRTKTLGGVTIREVDHTEAAYLIDPQGYERALFLYPYRAQDVAAAVRRVSG